MAEIRRLWDAIRDRIVRKGMAKRTGEAYTAWALRLVSSWEAAPTGHGRSRGRAVLDAPGGQ